MPKEALARSKARATAVEDDEDDFRQRAIINRKEKQESGLFKLAEGETTFRILRTPRDKQRNSPSVWIEYYVHRNVGPKKVGPMRCGINVADDSGSCWLCSMVEKLRDNGKTLAAAELERKKVYAVQVAVWDENLGDLRGPLLWVTSSGKTAKSLSYKLESIIAAPESKGYVNHDNGYNFTIERSGTGMNDTVYSAPARAEERSEVPEEILSKLKPFADVVRPYDKENQKKAYYGETGAVQETPKRSGRFDEDDEEEDKPKKLKPRSVVEEDEEDSIDSSPEEDDESIEDDEDDKPAKTARKPVEPDEDEDDLEFGEDEESESEEESIEDEEETPTPKKKSKKVVEIEDDEEAAPKPRRRR